MSSSALTPVLAAAVFMAATSWGRRQSYSPTVTSTVHRIVAGLPHNCILLLGPDNQNRQLILSALSERLSSSSGTMLGVTVDLRLVNADHLFKTLERASIRQLGMSNSGAARQDAPMGPRRFGRHLRAWLDQRETELGEPSSVILILDHLEQADRWDPVTQQRFRSLFMGVLGQRLVVVAFATSIDRSWSEPGSPWFNFFSEIDLCDTNLSPRQS